MTDDTDPRPPAAFVRAHHGTQSGYVLHKRAKEQACTACKAAHVRWNIDSLRWRKAGRPGEMYSSSDPPPPGWWSPG